MANPLEQLRTTLKQHGYSLTAARSTVFDSLQEREPQAMNELVKRCEGIDRASVYRTVTLFERLGIVQRLHIGWKYKLELTDAFSHHHHHLSCTKCGKTIPVPEDAALERRLQALAKAQHFSAQDHQVEIRGLCAICQQEKTSDK